MSKWGSDKPSVRQSSSLPCCWANARHPSHWDEGTTKNCTVNGTVNGTLQRHNATPAESHPHFFGRRKSLSISSHHHPEPGGTSQSPTLFGQANMCSWAWSSMEHPPFISIYTDIKWVVSNMQIASSIGMIIPYVEMIRKWQGIKPSTYPSPVAFPNNIGSCREASS